MIPNKLYKILEWNNYLTNKISIRYGGMSKKVAPILREGELIQFYDDYPVKDIILIDKEKKKMGVFDLHEALKLARYSSYNLKLLYRPISERLKCGERVRNSQIAKLETTADLPVVKIDASFEETNNSNISNQPKITNSTDSSKLESYDKEIEINLNIGKSDLNTKLKACKKFLEKKKSIKITLVEKKPDFSKIPINNISDSQQKSTNNSNFSDQSVRLKTFLVENILSSLSSIGFIHGNIKFSNKKLYAIISPKK